MRWKNKIWVFDDIIPVAQQEEIRDTLLGRGFPWLFVPDVTGGGVSEDERPAFSHNFIRAGEVNTAAEHLKLLEILVEPCLKKVNEETNTMGDYSIIQSRTFLQLPLSTVDGGEYDAHHVDLLQEHVVFLYYVCDADGDTVLFENMYSEETPETPTLDQLKEKTRVTPKQGRVVIFDGGYWHTATQPSKNVRCIINTDVVQHA